VLEQRQFGRDAEDLVERERGVAFGEDDGLFEQYQAGLEQGWHTGRVIRRSVPTAGSDETLMEWLSRLLRLPASPAAARAILDFAATIDVRGLLDRITRTLERPRSSLRVASGWPTFAARCRVSVER